MTGRRPSVSSGNELRSVCDFRRDAEPCGRAGRAVRGGRRRRHFQRDGAASRVPLLVTVGENYVAPPVNSETRRRGLSGLYGEGLSGGRPGLGREGQSPCRLPRGSAGLTGKRDRIASGQANARCASPAKPGTEVKPDRTLSRLPEFTGCKGDLQGKRSNLSVEHTESITASPPKSIFFSPADRW